MSRISIGAELYPQYSQAVDDEQGMRLIGCAFNDQALAKVGIADTPGAYIVTRWVTEWKRETLNEERCQCRYQTLSFGLQSEDERGSCGQCPHPLAWHGPSGCHGRQEQT